MGSAQYLILVKHSVPEILEDVPAREWHLSEPEMSDCTAG